MIHNDTAPLVSGVSAQRGGLSAPVVDPAAIANDAMSSVAKDGVGRMNGRDGYPSAGRAGDIAGGTPIPAVSGPSDARRDCRDIER